MNNMLSLDNMAFTILAATFELVLFDIISSYSKRISLVIHKI